MMFASRHDAMQYFDNISIQRSGRSDLGEKRVVLWRYLGEYRGLSFLRDLRFWPAQYVLGYDRSSVYNFLVYTILGPYWNYLSLFYWEIRNDRTHTHTLSSLR